MNDNVQIKDRILRFFKLEPHILSLFAAIFIINLGEQLAEAMIADGALDILSKAEEIAFKDEMPERL